MRGKARRRARHAEGVDQSPDAGVLESTTTVSPAQGISRQAEAAPPEKCAPATSPSEATRQAPPLVILDPVLNRDSDIIVAASLAHVSLRVSELPNGNRRLYRG